MSRRTSRPRPSYTDPPSTSTSDVDASVGDDAEKTDAGGADESEAEAEVETIVNDEVALRESASVKASPRTDAKRKSRPGTKASVRTKRKPEHEPEPELEPSTIRSKSRTQDGVQAGTVEGSDNVGPSSRAKRSKYFVHTPQASVHREAVGFDGDESPQSESDLQSQSDEYQESEDDEDDDEDEDEDDEAGVEDDGISSDDSDTPARRNRSRGKLKATAKSRKEKPSPKHRPVSALHTEGSQLTVPQLRKLEYEDTQKQQVKAKAKAKAEDSESGGEVFIRNLPALPAGNTPYKATTIHPNTLLFLSDLKQNNERDWFQQRDLQFRAGKSDFEDFVLRFAKMLQEHDDTIPELPVKDLVFRIYRDVRFSNDRTPYKTNMSAAFSRTGRKGAFACYYLSIEPSGKSMLGCGSWCPPSQDLSRIRRHIDRHADEWDKTLSKPEFVQFFKGFKGLLETEDKLKTCPKGYSKDHDRIELLKLKSFTIGIRFSDEEVTSDSFLEILDVVVEQMVPFVTLLNGIIRPEDLSSESDNTEND